MLKKHLKVISFGFMAICSYEMLQASQDQQFEDYSADFIDRDSLTEILSNFNDTQGLEKEPDYQSLRCDKREDRELALLRARRVEKQAHEDLRLKATAELRLAVMKRLENQHIPTGSTKSQLSLSTLSSPDSIQRPYLVQRQVAMTFASSSCVDYDADSEVSTPSREVKKLTHQYLQFSPIVLTDMSSMRTRAGSSPIFSQLYSNDEAEDSLSSHEELQVKNIEDASSDCVEL